MKRFQQHFRFCTKRYIQSKETQTLKLFLEMTLRKHDAWWWKCSSWSLITGRHKLMSDIILATTIWSADHTPIDLLLKLPPSSKKNKKKRLAEDFGMLDFLPLRLLSIKSGLYSHTRVHTDRRHLKQVSSSVSTAWRMSSHVYVLMMSSSHED